MVLKLFYAYALIFIGVVFEGELALLAGALSAQNGTLDIRLVGLTAFISTLSTDWILFYSGKYIGDRIMKRFPSLQKRTEKPRTWIRQNPTLILIFYRFLYGFRIVTLLILGMSQVNSRKFMSYSLLSVMIWSIVFSIIGYHLGGAFSSSIENFENIGLYFIVGILGLSLLVFLVKTSIRMLKPSVR